MTTHDKWTQDQNSLALTTPLGKDKLILSSLRGREAISQPFSYDLEMFSGDKTLDLTKLVGKSVSVEVRLDDGKLRYINGVVSRFSLVRSDPKEDLAFYEAEIRPWFWLLNYRGGFKVYQKQTAKQIIQAALDGTGLASNAKINLSGTYAEREYCVQYGETDFAFLSRLMEEEGIYYWFDHQKTKHVMVIADDAGAHVNTPLVHKLRYRSMTNPTVEDDIITDCRFEHSVVPRSFGLDDFNFETPSTDLASSSSSSRSSKTSYDLSETGLATYPGRYGKSNVGTQFAKIRLEAEELPERLLTASGTCRSLIPGYKVEISEHARDDVNGAWVVQDISIRANAQTFDTTFTAFPAAVQFRPPMVTPKAVIHSTQTAIVTGPDGEEIYTDKYGRVQVKFHWAKGGADPSCWIRCAHGWAGKGWGILFVPRVGQEVVVSFLDGDPDRPLITGAVYNGENTPPYLPSEKTKSTIKTRSSAKGSASTFNEIRFEDKKGSEELFIQAEKDMNVNIKNDQTTDIENDQTLNIKHDRTTTIDNDDRLTVKDDRIEQIDNNRQRTVGGKETITVDGDTKAAYGGKQTITVAKDAKYTMKAKETRSVKAAAKHEFGANLDVDVKGNYTLNVKGNLTIKATGNVTIEGMKVGVKAKSQMDIEGAMTTLKGKGSCETSASGAMTVKGGIVKIN